LSSCRSWERSMTSFTLYSMIPSLPSVELFYYKLSLTLTSSKI
jgi:hypothetical protein